MNHPTGPGARPTTPQVFTPELLNQCISCGFCLPACPTYRLTKDEASSPRGRITLMRSLQAGTLSADDPAVAEQASYCLGCRACEPVCPAGVQYGDLLEEWRAHQWRGRRGPLLARALTTLLRQRWLIRLLGRLRRAARTSEGPGPHLMLGCAERFLYPGVSRAAQRLAPHLDARSAQGCCGALHAHNGEPARGRALGQRLGQQLPGHVVTTSGGCAAHLAAVLGRGRVSELSDHLTQRQVQLGEVSVAGRRARVTLQDSCHLRNALGVWRQPRQLLEQVADYVEVPDAAACCGAAGTYSLLRPRDSNRILAPKLDQIEAAGVDYVVTVNPGCLRQLQQGLGARKSHVRAVHLAEFLARASR